MEFSNSESSETKFFSPVTSGMQEIVRTIKQMSFKLLNWKKWRNFNAQQHLGVHKQSNTVEAAISERLTASDNDAFAIDPEGLFLKRDRFIENSN